MKEAAATRLHVSRETVPPDVQRHRHDGLERTLESLSGMAIAGINRDKQQQTLLEQILTRLTDLEKK